MLRFSTIAATGMLAGALTSAGGQQLPPLPQQFEIDAAHSIMGFSAGFMGLSKVRGAFATFGGTIMYVPTAIERSSVSAIILTRSISTNTETRDRHLKSPDFFDAEKYPYITFRSTAIRKTPNGFIADGDFAMHGVTKRLSIPFTLLNAPMADAWGNQRMTYQANLTLSRKEYGILGTAFWNSEFDPGRMAVSDDIAVELLVSATIPNTDRWSDVVGDSLLKEIDRQGVAPTLAQLKAARSSNPKIDSIPPFSFVVVAEKLANRGRMADAVGVYSAAIEIRQRAPLLTARQASLLARMGERARATTLFESVLQMDSLNTVAAEWLRVLRGSASR
jgi:polyisoprenoid-binding protein YceI